MKRFKAFLGNNWKLITLLTVFGVLLLLHLGRDQYLDWDECIFSQQAKEMHLSGNFLTNFWNYQPILEKPPLTNWLISTFNIFGFNEFVSRIPMVLVSLILLALIYQFCKKYFSERVALLSVVILTGAVSFITYSYRLNSDIVFTMFTFAGFSAWIASEKKSALSYLGGLLLGLAVMSKGLSIVPYIAALGLSIFFNFQKQRVRDFIKMCVVFLLTILPWHIYMYLTYGKQFIQVYIVEQLLRRAKYPLDFHYEGRLFYVKEIFLNFFIGLILSAIAYMITAINFLKIKNTKSFTQLISKHHVILTIFTVIILTGISITQVRTRLWWYALPLFPFVSVFLGYSIDLLILKTGKKNQLAFLIVFVGLCLYSLFVINKEINIFNFKSEYSARNLIFLKVKDYPQKDIYYLVWFPERQARTILPDNLHTSTTFIFGGNPCAVYYSNKKINYIYTVDEFMKDIQSKHGLFVIENGDSHYLEGQPVKQLYKNSDYTLFER